MHGGSLAFSRSEAVQGVCGGGGLWGGGLQQLQGWIHAGGQLILFQAWSRGLGDGYTRSQRGMDTSGACEPSAASPHPRPAKLPYLAASPAPPSPLPPPPPHTHWTLPPTPLHLLDSPMEVPRPPLSFRTAVLARISCKRDGVTPWGRPPYWDQTLSPRQTEVKLGNTSGKPPSVLHARRHAVTVSHHGVLVEISVLHAS